MHHKGAQRCVVLAVIASYVALVLQGCGGGSDDPSPPLPSHTFKLNPIEVRGQHLFDSVTHKPFFAVGIAFPDSLPPDDPKPWVSVLQRIADLGNKVNMVRLYEVPRCIWNDLRGSCFYEFMVEADKRGIYVVFPGTGSLSGYIPRDGWQTAQECYQNGEVLNMGRGIVQRASYPNTLAIVIGNEFFMKKDDFRAASVFKAYARDMKAYMNMCNVDEKSPSKGKMRQIPLMYADRDLGDELTTETMTYLKCGAANISVDIYGLNIERWCKANETTAYDGIHKAVEDAKLPGTFMFSEMGCPQNLVTSAPDGQSCRVCAQGTCCPRSWSQVPIFFKNFKMFDGFSAYAYWNSGAFNFNMLDGKSGSATLYPDGEFFFKMTNSIEGADREIVEIQHPVCATMVNGADVLPIDDIQPYEVDKYPASTCPSSTHMSRSSVTYM
jgi:hypothetical protein